LEYYINKIIMLNKKMSIFWIWLILIILLIGLLSDVYFIHIINADLDSYVNVHVNIKNK
jgi:hypothetical protein